MGKVNGVSSYAYSAKKDTQISFPKGVVIDILEQKKSGWFYGEFDGNKGLFPGNYVKITEEAVNKASSPTAEQVKANHAFKAAKDTHLAFPKGAVITVTEKKSSGWWKGEYEGKTGTFPGNYVKPIESTAVTPSVTPAPPITTPPVATVLSTVSHESLSEAIKRQQDSEQEISRLKSRLEEIQASELSLNERATKAENETEELRGKLEDLITNARIDARATIAAEVEAEWQQKLQQMTKNNDDAFNMKGEEHRTVVLDLKQTCASLGSEVELTKDQARQESVRLTAEVEVLRQQIHLLQEQNETYMHEVDVLKAREEGLKSHLEQELRHSQNKEEAGRLELSTIESQLKLEKATHDRTALDLSLTKQIVEDLAMKQDMDLEEQVIDLSGELAVMDDEVSRASINLQRRLQGLRVDVEKAIGLADSRSNQAA
eukprot:TRINITY_DN4213_c0_g1_i3.p1 TRINITY_DN4213_c0_g1~~TRINITY_DN4213_c0_g1_i3.p1  ORF type:complete len:431 (-),score=87.90 TRINITY_DN4213_c0_g1_i3:67-1359(-)